MPGDRARVLLPLLLPACSPSAFVWNEHEGAAVAAYRDSFVGAAGDRFDDAISLDTALDRIRGERVLWLGDHHPSQRLHELQLALLEALRRRGITIVLLLEAIGTQDEPAVKDFLSGACTLAELRTRTLARWEGSWLDDPSVDGLHYRAMLSFARRHRVPVLGLEPTPRPSIGARDDAIAARVRHAATVFPDRLVVVQVGQAHLLGRGDLIARTGHGGFAIGGEPTPPLHNAARPAVPGECMLRRSSGGLWWFGELLGSR